MKAIRILAALALIPLLACSGRNPEGYQLVWADDFNSTSLDTTKWQVYDGNGCPNMCGFGNRELQYYTARKENVRVENGLLVIEAHREGYDKNDYTSAKLQTREEVSFRYGYVEIGARLPNCRGTWPALWMLPELDRPMNWPEDGEVDIMEHVGYNAGMVYGTIHTGEHNHIQQTQVGDSIFLPDAHETFHVYALEWTPNELIWLVDGKEYHRVERTGGVMRDWPFDRNFSLIMNLAVGGNWGGKHGVDDSCWPQRLLIDFVRVYRPAT